MALTLALIEGFDFFNSASDYAGLSGVSFTTSGWTLGVSGRLAGAAARGPANTSSPMILNADRLTSTSPSDTYFLMAGLKFNLASAQRRIRFLDSGDVAHVDIEVNASGAFVVKNGDGTTLGTSTAGLVLEDIWGTFESKVVISNGAGIVQIRWNGVQVINITSADTQNAGTAEVAKISFTPDGDIDDLVGFIGATGDSFPGPRKVVAKRPASDDAVEFGRSSGTANAQMVDDSVGPDDDTTYNASSTVDHRDAFNLATVDESGTVDGVRPIMAARKTDVGIRRMKFVHDNNSDPAVESATEKELLTSYAYFDEMILTEPGGSAWSAGTINSNDWGYKLST